MRVICSKANEESIEAKHFCELFREYFATEFFASHFVAGGGGVFRAGVCCQRSRATEVRCLYLWRDVGRSHGGGHAGASGAIGGVDRTDAACGRHDGGGLGLGGFWAGLFDWRG